MTLVKSAPKKSISQKTILPRSYVTVAPMRGIYLQLKQSYSEHDYFTLKIDDSAFLVFTFQFFL